MKKKLIEILIISTIVFLIIVTIPVEINNYVQNSSENYIYSDIEQVPSKYTGLILGAGVYADGSLSIMLKDRVDSTIDLYNAKKISRILVSGDHGKEYYDEVNSIKDYLLEKQIPREDIFLDHAGFDTYDSIVRAKKIFKVEDMIVVTNEFHLSRAVYTAREIGIDAVGFIADKQDYVGVGYNELREVPASIKIYFDVKLNSKPQFLGEEIPISGSSLKSWDKFE